MPTLTQLKRTGYNQQRAASLGARITLVAGYGYYSALFECASFVASVLGERSLTDVGDGILEVIPCYRITTEDMFEALGKLSKKFSIGLVEYNCSGKDERSPSGGGHFVCVWRINRIETSNEPLTPSTDLNDY